MKRIVYIVTAFMMMLGIAGAQTQSTLPTGSVLFSNNIFESPDGLLWSGKAGKYVCIGSKTDYNALIKAGYTKAQVDSIAVEVRKRSTHTGTQAINTIAGLQSVLDSKIQLSEKGASNGVATLDINSKVPMSQIPDALVGSVNYQGNWNPSTNTPTLPTTPSGATKGHYYIASVTGTFNGIEYNNGDWIISNGSVWGKVDNNNKVVSVNGKQGAVVIGVADIAGLQGFLDNKADKTTTISGTGDLTGGGSLAANRTIDLSASAKTQLANGNTAFGWGNHANANYWKKNEFNFNTIVGSGTHPLVGYGSTVTTNWFGLTYSGGYGNINWFSQASNDNSGYIRTHAGLAPIRFTVSGGEPTLYRGSIGAIGSDITDWTAYKIWHSGDFSQTDINKWNGYDTRFVDKSTNQSGLGGDKYWTANHVWGNKLAIYSTGSVAPLNSSSIDAGMYGLYDQSRVGHIWSVGSPYRISSDGTGLGGIYGLAYAYRVGGNGNTSTPWLSGHQILFASAGEAKASISLSDGAINTLGHIITANSITGANIVSNGPSGTNRGLQFRTNGVLRWNMGADATIETGNGTGSDFAIYNYNDDGSYRSRVFAINRINGNASFSNNLSANGRMYIATPGVPSIGDNALNLTSQGVKTTMGSINPSYFHFNTEATNGFYFYQNVDVAVLNSRGTVTATGGNSTQWNQAFADRVTTNTAQTITGNKVFQGGISTKDPDAVSRSSYYAYNHDSSVSTAVSSDGVTFRRPNSQVSSISVDSDGGSLHIYSPVNNTSSGGSTPKITIRRGATKTSSRTVEFNGRASYAPPVAGNSETLDNIIGALEDSDLVPKKVLPKVEILSTVLNSNGDGTVNKSSAGSLDLYMYTYVGSNFDGNSPVTQSQLRITTSINTLSVSVSAGSANAGKTFNVFVTRILK